MRGRCSMRSLLFMLLVSIFATVTSSHGAAQSTSFVRAIDSTRSRATFSTWHVYVEKVEGSVPIMSGEVTVENGSTTPSQVRAVLDATHLRSGDDDRDANLQSPDWFDTKRFPTWTFTSTKIVPASNGGFGLDGILTIHGVGVPEHLDVTVSGDRAAPVYHAVAHVDRHAFGMTVTRLDPIVGGTVDVTLLIALK